MAEMFKEAFKELQLLQEETFSADRGGIYDLDAFLDGDNLEDNTVLVVDPEAEEEDDLEDSYVGKVIFKCPVCKTLSYFDADNVDIEPQSDVANVSDECPYCHSVGGFKVVGEVAPFKKVEIKSDEKEEVKADEEELEETSEAEVVEESLKEDEKVTPRSRDDIDAIADDKKELAKKRFMRRKDDADSDKDYQLKRNELKEPSKLDEDTVKQGNYWVNKGKEGTHGKFKTKKAADAQRRAMFAQGYEENLDEEKSVAPRTRDDIDAIADDKKEKAKAVLARLKDDADSDKDYQLKRNKLKEPTKESCHDKKLKEQDEEIHVYTEDPEPDIDFDFYEDGMVEDGIVIAGNRDFQEKGDPDLIEIIKASDDDFVLQELEAKTGKPYTKKTIRGYVQGDWNTMYYPVDTIEEFLNDLADYYFGNCSAFYPSDSDAIDDPYITIPDHLGIYEKEDIKKYIAQELGVPEDKVKIRKFTGYSQVANYDESCHRNSDKKKLKEAVKDEAYDVAEMMVSSFGEKKLITWDEFNDLFDSAKNDIGIKDSFEDPDFENDVRGILSMYGYATIFEGENEGGLELVESKSCAKRASKKKLKEAPIYGLTTQFDSRKSFGGKAQVDVQGDKQLLYSYDTPVAKIEAGKVTLLPKWDFSATTLRHVKEFLKQNGFKAETRNQIAADYAQEMEEACGKSIKKTFKKVKEDKTSKTDRIDAKRDNRVEKARKALKKTIDDADAQRDDEKKTLVKEDLSYGELVTIDSEWEKFKKKKGKSDADTAWEFIETECKGVYDTDEEKEELFGYISTLEEPVEESCKERKVEEALEKVELETGNEKITISSEPKEIVEKREEKEVIEPLSKETVDKIENEDSTEEDAMEDEVDVASFDDVSIDELGEAYLKEVYGNVKDFKTSKISKDGKKITVEGLINFNSGASKNTTFTFSPSKTTKSGKVKYVGENLAITKNNNAFTLTGKTDGGRFIPESLTYNYGVKNDQNKTQRIYGRVKKSK